MSLKVLTVARAASNKLASEKSRTGADKGKFVLVEHVGNGPTTTQATNCHNYTSYGCVRCVFSTGGNGVQFTRSLLMQQTLRHSAFQGTSWPRPFRALHICAQRLSSAFQPVNFLMVSLSGGLELQEDQMYVGTVEPSCQTAS